MTINEVQSARETVKSSGAAADSVSSDRAAKNRELARTVQSVNEGGGVGANSEVRFAIDQRGQALIRIVDRITDEVITQFPPETALRAAEVLKSLQPGERVA